MNFNKFFLSSHIIVYYNYSLYIYIIMNRGSARPTGVGASASSQASQVIQASTYRVSRALCSVCGRCMPVTRAGVLRVHGPLSNRCAGSGMGPSSASSAAATVTTATTTTLTADANGANGQGPTLLPGPFPSESLLQLSDARPRA